ncbi:restriction endonuclease subunit S [Leyella stercorea]|uniref:restriction endonuclease subunit S n=1 Tax=Leyella stercorea TaxID=363265 RepID=UPI00242FAC60|nr:restriction endonuclease subunit S [Leyella stercorea]
MNTKALRQKILDLAIHGKLVPQDPNDEPASVLLERIRDEKERLIKEGKIKRPKKIKTTSDKPHYENVPFEVPSSWIWSTVNEINMYNSKNVDPAKQKENTFELYSVPIFPTNTPEIIKGEKIGSAKQSVENGDVLLCKINPKINRVWFVKNRTENTMIASSEWIVIRNKFMLTDYLVFCFMSPYFRDLMENNVSGVGGSLTRAQPSMVANYAIPIPPLQEQKRIITEIKHWFELIDVIDQGKECLQGTIKKAKSKILDLAIHGKFVPQVPTDEPASELLKRINPKAEITCDNGHYQKLPEGWVITPMQTLCALVDGEKQNGIERINLDVKYLRGEREAKVLTSGKYTTANTLLILVDGENSGEVFRAPVDGYQGSTFKQLSIHEEMYTDYVLQVINLHRKTLRENKVGSAIPHLNKKLFKAINVPIPPYEEQKRIVNAINQTFTILDKIMENL